MSLNTRHMLQMIIAGLAMDPNTRTPIIVLKDPESEVCLPVWIGSFEASAIAVSLHQSPMPRPLTHDLIVSLLQAAGAVITKVLIHKLENNTFYANIELCHGDLIEQVDARPSDAIALAVRYGCPIFVGQDVLDIVNAKVIENGDVITLEMRTGEVNDPDSDDESTSGGYSTLDKESWEGVLEAMDPEDFKYKM